MGVLGLTPFIQKHCPEVIKELPQRLRSLSGKTIVIDGTLITQRFHFAPIPFEYRHILGWYRLIRDLKDVDVKVICVFDGEERSQAKQRENERRKRTQRMDVARGAMEVERLQRLRHLSRLLERHRALPGWGTALSTPTLQSIFRRQCGRQETLGTKQRPPHGQESDIFCLGHELSCLEPIPYLSPISLTPGGQNATPRAVLKLQDAAASRSAPPLSHDLAGLNRLVEPDGPDDVRLSNQGSKFNSNSLNDLFGLKVKEPPISESAPRNLTDQAGLHEEEDDTIEFLEGNLNVSDAITPSLDASTASSVRVLQPLEPAIREGHTSPGPNLDVSFKSKAADATYLLSDISQGLLTLYQDYHQSIPAFMSQSLLGPPVELHSEEAAASTREQYVMSKNQVQLTLDEGHLWESLMRPSAADSASTEDQLESLAQRSDNISKSYEKRNNPPNLKTYEESKKILQAMGVPYIESTVPYEAEALAASIVHNGFADYVASEDTDVLIYEVPLLRNITNRQSPLTLLSGAEVREVLQLDRASYIDFALLLGTDFSQRIKNLGPHRAIKLIRAHGRIENVIANEPKFVPRLPYEAYLAQVEVARLVFERLPPVPDSRLLQPTEGDEAAVEAILDKYGLRRAAMVDWDFASALEGNYFGDDPTVS